MPTDAEGLTLELLDAAFPFHLVLDEGLGVVACGHVLAKLCPEVRDGARFDDCFRIVTPRLDHDFKSICEQAFTVFFLECVSRPLTLKGQMVRTAPADGLAGGRLLFLCSPVVRDLSSLSELGLTLNDFAMHDSAVELLILLRASARTVDEVDAMAKRLREEIGERKRAEEELREVNRKLERRVMARTQDLARSNARLQSENTARRSVELKLRAANQDLAGSIARLERHYRQVSLLNGMGDGLQACSSVHETYEIVTDALQEVFPASRGQLCLRDDRSGDYRVVAIWGDLLRPERRFEASSCAALREQRPVVMEPPRDRGHPVTCGHLALPADSLVICAPLGTQAEPVGLLHVQFESEAPGCADLAEWSTRQQLAVAAAEHVGLAINNLKLRETLHRQSLCDALTGLYNRRYLEEALAKEVMRSVRSERPLAVLMIDIDHFKQVNDTWGHPLGDRLLADFGAFLLDHVRAEDIACRYGGEEFTLILRDTPREAALARAESIRAQAEQELLADTREGPDRLTISIGLAIHPADARDPASLVAEADRALYAAKAAGRNRVMSAS